MWLLIASLNLAERLRPTALPHGSALHLSITCKLLLCVRLGMSRDRRCGHHAAETPLYAPHMMWPTDIGGVQHDNIVILTPKPSGYFRTG